MVTGRARHATTCAVTTGAASNMGTDAVLRDWRAVRGDDSIQYAPVTRPEPPRPPQWLQDLLEWISRHMGPAGEWLAHSWPVLKWVLVNAT